MTNHTINIKVTTRAASNKIGEIYINASGQAVLKIYTTAVAEHGKANESLISFLAKAWQMPKKDIIITKGLHSNNKLLTLTNPPAQVIKLLTHFPAAI